MKAPPYPVPVDEVLRIEALRDYHIMDTPPEEDFDRLVALAARLFDVPIATISLIEADRQFYKARVGIEVCETKREVSFCAHAIMSDDILVLPDAALDPRFSTNPYVIGPPFIRFYAGKPLITPSGARLGTLCLIDTRPRSNFTLTDRKNLADLALLVMDRMEMRRLDHAKSVSQARFANIAATSPDAIICSNAEREVTFWNSAAERLFGYSYDEISKLSFAVIVSDSWRPIYERELERLRRGEALETAGRTIELTALRRDGTEFPAECSLSTWSEGNVRSWGAIVRDISERRRSEDRLYRLATFDPLTELPNRGAWHQCLSSILLAEKPATILLLDLNNFKHVNDTLGHIVGDGVLIEVANRLRAGCNDAIMLGRLGGDEFVVLLPGNDPRGAVAVASALVSAIGEPMEVQGRRADVGVTIGIALSPQHGVKPDELLSAADLALYKAKALKSSDLELFVPLLRDVAVARHQLEHELRRADERGEFELFYQPQVATTTGRLLGAEALLRWNHPERGLLSPASFIDVLAQQPFSSQVGEWILATACRQAAQWRRHISNFQIGVNLFDSQFKSGGLTTSVRGALENNKLPPEALELELVENILLRDDKGTLQLLASLRALGVGLAFDDYGTGFASLSFLKRFPVTRLKIDRSFVKKICASPNDAAIVKAIIYLGESFGLRVIAEGVETDAEREFLEQIGCAEIQGFLFGRPMPAGQFSAKYSL